MGWETRKGRGQYYVQKRRRGDKVRSCYVGGGLVGRLAAREDQEARHMAQQARRGVSAARREAEAQDAELSTLCRSVWELSRLWLEARGYYRHHGEWRRKGPDKMKPAGNPLSEQQKALYMKAQAGDRKAAGELFTAWEDTGVLAEKFEIMYDALFSYTNARAGKNLVLFGAMHQKREALRKSLSQEGDTELEALLIEQIVVCSFHMGDMQTTQCKRMEEGSTAEEVTFRDKMIDRAQRRYLMAVRELGIARRLRMTARTLMTAEDEETRLRMLQGGKQPEPVTQEAA